MADTRQLQIPFPDNEPPWENTMGAQFSTSLNQFARQRNWPPLNCPQTDLAESIVDQAEERAGKLLERPFVKIAALALLAQSATTTIQSLVAECSAVCESPIELAMCFALAIVAREGDRGVTFTSPEGPIGDADGPLHFTIEPQAKIGSYRVDFLITALLVDNDDDQSVFRSQAVVECDGYDWHDATKEQAIRDRRRDRELQAQGFSVFRFAGAEIWLNCFKCAGEVTKALVDAIEGQKAPTLRKKGPESVRASQPEVTITPER